MNKQKTDEALKTIGEVEKIVEVPGHVLRFWEDKFESLTPLKNRGRRYFNQSNINLILEIKKLLYIENYSIKKAQEYFSNMKKDKKTIETNSNLSEDKKSKLIEIKKNLVKLRDKLLNID